MFWLWVIPLLCAQQPDHQHMPGMQMPPAQEHSAGMSMSAAGMHLMQQSSGTAVNPASSPEPMLHAKFRSWNVMFHGLAFLNSAQQTGPRGSDKIFSTNWVMGMAEREVGRGSVMVRTMLSLEPATITQRRYPELFQTGETAYGRPIVDGQHPHNFVMEAAVEYARPIGDGGTMFSIYAAPVGDPALGPVAYPHRISAAEIPQGTLSHHLQDSTHISYDVITAGVKRGMFRLEASGFHGAEPGENRWTVGYGTIDSWAARLWVTPAANWSGQVSVGRLAKPEALEPGDVVRSTASLTYNRPLRSGNWATSAIWGRNHKTFEGRNTNSYLLESALRFDRRNYVTGRFELVDKDELFADETGSLPASFAGAVFRIQAYTLGYTRDIPLIRRFATGIGANFTLYGVPSALNTYYGSRPAGFMVFLRVKPEPPPGDPHHHGG